MGIVGRLLITPGPLIQCRAQREHAGLPPPNQNALTARSRGHAPCLAGRRWKRSLRYRRLVRRAIDPAQARPPGFLLSHQTGLAVP